MVEYVKSGMVFFAYERAPSGIDSVRNYKDLQRLGGSWDGKTLVGLYNNLASTQGLTPVKKFTNRETGIQTPLGTP